MPFGLTCAPSVFQRLMDLVLCGLTYWSVLVYLDDIIVFASDFHSHMQRLREVLLRLRMANLKLHPSKCFLFQRKVNFLGHVISRRGIEVQEDKVAAVKNWPRPRNLTELRSFLGLCSYYRRFIDRFADVAAPLHELQRKNVPFEWTAIREDAFARPKQALTSAPVLGMPRDDCAFTLDTDASEAGCGAVLSQQQDGVEVVIMYASRSLSRAERNYDVTKKELLAVVYGLKTFKQYLLGRHFQIRTDHAALQWLRKTPEPMGQQARWLTFIEMFDFGICHRSGQRHTNADALSRKPHVSEGVQVTSARAIITRDEIETNKSELSPYALPFVPLSESQTNNKVIGPVAYDSLSRCTYGEEEIVDDEMTNEHGQGRHTATEDAISPLSGESIADMQLRDPDIGPILRLRLQSDSQPGIDAVLSESSAAKVLWSQWCRLKIIDGALYRDDKRVGGVQVQQLVVPTECKAKFHQDQPIRC